MFLKLLRCIYKGIEIPDPDAILNNMIDANCLLIITSILGIFTGDSADDDQQLFVVENTASAP